MTSEVLDQSPMSDLRSSPRSDRNDSLTPFSADKPELQGLEGRIEFSTWVTRDERNQTMYHGHGDPVILSIIQNLREAGREGMEHISKRPSPAFREALYRAGRCSALWLQEQLALTEQDPLGSNVILRGILRAAWPFVNGMTKILPYARIDYVGAARNESDPANQTQAYTLGALPHKDRIVVYADPFFATGGSAIQALNIGKTNDAREQAYFVSVFGVEEGLQRFATKHPDVVLHTLSLEHHLNDTKFIIPGAGGGGELCDGLEGRSEINDHGLAQFPYSLTNTNAPVCTILTQNGLEYYRSLHRQTRDSPKQYEIRAYAQALGISLASVFASVIQSHHQRSFAITCTSDFVQGGVVDEGQVVIVTDAPGAQWLGEGVTAAFPHALRGYLRVDRDGNVDFVKLPQDLAESNGASIMYVADPTRERACSDNAIRYLNQHCSNHTVYAAVLK